MSESILIPMFPNGRIDDGCGIEVPRIAYHSNYGEPLLPCGSIKAFPLRERYAEASDGFSKKQRKGEFIWLSPTPLSKDAFVVDLALLEPSDVRLTGQIEGYMLHSGNLPMMADTAFGKTKLQEEVLPLANLCQL